MKGLKTLLALGLSVVLTAGVLSGCGGSAGSGSSGQASGETQEAAGDTGTQEAAFEDTETQAAAGDEGISADSPYAGKGFDLSERKTVVMYALGDRPADMDEVLEKLNNDYLIPWLNSELEMQFLNWSDYTTKYSLVLAGGETVDLMYTAAWCYYNDEAAKGAFMELTPEWLETNMPYSYPQQPEESWDQIAIGDKIYAIPRSGAFFNGYMFVAVRSDMMDKYGYESLSSWDDYTSYLKDVAADTKTTGISASAMTPTRDETTPLWSQTQGISAVVSGQDWFYQTNNSEKAPAPENIFYYYTSDYYLQYALESAELAAAGCWSSNAINDTNDPRDSFANGTSASYSYNETIYSVGKDLESAGLGTYEAYDLAPGFKRARGSYADDAIAIATNSKDPVRAALVLDALKAFPEVNNLIIGGIQGKHFDLDEDGNRIVLDGSAGYAWNAWSWALQRYDQPQDATMDDRQKEFLAICEDNVYVPEFTGFTFDKAPVEAELNVINSIRDEYKYSFTLGVYGKDTEAKFEEFKGKLEAAGLEKVTEEFKSQYMAYCEKKGISPE